MWIKICGITSFGRRRSAGGRGGPVDGDRFRFRRRASLRQRYTLPGVRNLSGSAPPGILRSAGCNSTFGK